MSNQDLDLFLRGSIGLCLFMVAFNAIRYPKRKMRSVYLGGAFALLALEMELYRLEAAWPILALIGVLIFAILVLDFVMSAITNPPNSGGPK